MSLVINETLAGVELATGLPIYEELYSLHQLPSCPSFIFVLTTSEPSIASPPEVVDTSPNGSSFGRSSELRRAMNRSSPTEGSELIKTNVRNFFLCAVT